VSNREEIFVRPAAATSTMTVTNHHPAISDMQRRAVHSSKVPPVPPSEPSSSGTTRTRDLALSNLPTAPATHFCM